MMPLKFPWKGVAPEAAKPPAIQKAPVLESFTREMGLDILSAARKTVAGAKAIIELARAKRDLARQAGIEIACVEMLAIMEGEKFRRVLDATDALGVSDDKFLYLTQEGVAQLRTMEGLLAEASSNIQRFTGGGLSGRPKLGETSSVDPSWLVPMIVFSAVVIVGVVIASFAPREKGRS